MVVVNLKKSFSGATDLNPNTPQSILNKKMRVKSVTKPTNKPQTSVFQSEKENQLEQILKGTGGTVKSSVEGIQDLRPVPPSRPSKKSRQQGS
ncbi:hypothetical protein OW495_20465 [Vibrio sp. 14N.309.X.WAT.E.F5]|uniref:hypothetical protein n=1 Tax=Vibrio TaxID=662 RepID=UPI0003825CF1|nr:MULTISPECIES: hypothetical protein [Vibrio]MDN2669104.1 hypothetical protein [Vibrio sp. 14N.309.X.WAT.E.F5]OEE88323.1 hypothetical protein A140_06920 [Vibrio crassostreae 9ZC88]PTP45929.1 hypothetical protein CWN87_02135 [Vibrio splendidus]